MNLPILFNMRRRIIFIILFSVYSSAGVYSSERPDHDLANMYLRDANFYYLHGDYGRAGDLAKISLEFWPEYSDPRYILGLIHVENRRSFWFDALRNSNWIEFELRQVIFDCIPLARNDAEYDILYDLLKRNDLLNVSDEVSTLLVGSVLSHAGMPEECNSFLQQATDEFPANSELKRMMIVRDPEYAMQYARYSIENSIVFPSESFARDLIDSVPDDRIKKDLIGRFFREGFTDPAYLLEYTSDIFPNVWELESFIQRFSPDTQELIDRISSFSDDKNLNSFLLDYLSAFNGIFVSEQIDSSGYRKRGFFDHGRLMMLDVDIDGDFDPEYHAVFSNGKPASFQLLRDDIIITYSNYPYVEKIEAAEQDGRRTVYTFNSGVLRLSPLGLSTLPTMMPDFIECPPDLLDIAGKNAVKIELYDTGSLVREEYIYPDGKAFSRSTVDGIQSLPFNETVRGPETVQTIDFDDDGKPEIFRIFSNGNMVMSMIDENDDSRYEYKETADYAYWDLNDDSVYDLCMMKGDSGNNEYRFSSAMDGNFDIQVFEKDGIIESVVDRGTPKVLDKNDDNTFRLGEIPPGMAIPEDFVPPGYYITDTGIFYIFRFMEHTYIQEVF